jgi:transposase InsO family protein
MRSAHTPNILQHLIIGGRQETSRLFPQWRVMFSENDFQSWCQSLELSEQARALIGQIRASDPSRHVRSAVGNVSGRYPSRKMKRTIQFESHRNELAAILEMEHDADTCEFYDQPPPIRLHYQGAKGKAVSVLHTPDYFVIRRGSAAWIECKTEEQLLKLAASQPNRFHFEETSKSWRCPPGEAYAAQFGLGYSIKSSAGIDWTYQRNVLFLEDFLRAERLEISSEMIEYLRSRAAATPGRALSEFLAETSRNGLSGDCLYIAIVTDQIYVDLRAAALAEPERVRVYFDEASARLYRETGRHPSPLLPSTRFKLSAGEILNWDGKTWEMINQGESNVWLKDDAGSVISLSEQTLSSLLSQGSARIVGAPSATDAPDGHSAKDLLARASAADLAEANRRYAILTAYRAGGWNQELGATVRTLQRWEAGVRQAEAIHQCGYAGLLPQIKLAGNRTPRLPEETRRLVEEHIGKEYENERQPTRFAVWSKLLRECESRGLPAPSYRAFCQSVARRPRYEQIKKRQGRRAAYSVQEFFYELSEQTPRHGDHPFEIAHIDHTELDIELVCSQTGGNLGRPWATFMTDAFSRRLLAVYLSFDPPSYRSCMMIFRECVSRHHRLPQMIVVDGGREFESVYFETLLARYEIVKKTRPPSQSRFGSVCERLFGTANTRFIYNLTGNTQMTRGNLRLITKEVDPRNLAIWTFGALEACLREWAYEFYDSSDHPALGQSPREAFLMAQVLKGARLNRAVYPNEEFEMLTLPTTARGAARVMAGRGVKINYIYYWCEAFRDADVEGSEVPVRYDPYDAGRAYAYVRDHWHQCHSEHYLKFQQRTERELMIAAAELRRRNQQHGKRLSITAHRLASFLSSLEAEEATLQQRLRDAEARRSREQTNVPAPARAPISPAQIAAPKLSERSASDQGVAIRTYAPSELEVYEEY